MSIKDMPLMKCGCQANSYHHLPDGTTEPACVIHAPHPDAYTVIEKPDLTGRKARCSYYGRKLYKGGPIYPHGTQCPVDGVCKCEVDSSFDGLPFFEYQGPGSPACDICQNCGQHKRAHPSQGGTGNYKNSTDKIRGLCEHEGKTFKGYPDGQPYDRYYCGCHGWD